MVFPPPVPAIAARIGLVKSVRRFACPDNKCISLTVVVVKITSLQLLYAYKTYIIERV
jgi:hypothetical protein